ncbi:MAG: NlpC/P60 family protein [Candidatus Paceibacterota bacterium]
MKKNIFKKTIALLYLTFILISFTTPVYFSLAATVCRPPEVISPDGNSCVPPTSTDYVLLAPLPGLETSFDPTQQGNLGAYLNVMIKLFIGICAVLAVIMIVMGGIEYMTSELISSKEHGKERIRNAILGLLLALGAYTLLFTINPDLLKTDLSSLKQQTVIVDLGGEGSAPLTQATLDQLAAIGINCPKSGGSDALLSIAQSYVGRSDYSRENRNTISNGTAHVDCSSFAEQTYRCAGLSSPGSTSAGIFGPGTRSIPVTSVSADGTMINGLPIQTGDLIGWTAGGSEKYGHVMIYIGGGRMIDAQGQGGVGVRPVSSYAGRIKYVNRYP